MTMPQTKRQARPQAKNQARRIGRKTRSSTKRMNRQARRPMTKHRRLQTMRMRGVLGDSKNATTHSWYIFGTLFAAGLRFHVVLPPLPGASRHDNHHGPYQHLHRPFFFGRSDSRPSTYQTRPHQLKTRNSSHPPPGASSPRLIQSSALRNWIAASPTGLTLRVLARLYLGAWGIDGQESDHLDPERRHLSLEVPQREISLGGV